MPDNHNTVSTPSPESSPNDDSGPWGKEYKDSVPPFRGEYFDTLENNKETGATVDECFDYLTNLQKERSADRQAKEDAGTYSNVDDFSFDELDSQQFYLDELANDFAENGTDDAEVVLRRIQRDLKLNEIRAQQYAAKYGHEGEFGDKVETIQQIYRDFQSGLERYEHITKVPDYLADINPERWEQIVETSAQFSRDFPDSVFMGGTALRLFYAAETGELPFGEGSGDLDTFVPAESLAKYRDNLPNGYEIVDTGENKDDRICVRTPSGEEVDVFGWSEDYESTEIEVDGQTVRVESLTSQILTRVHLAETSDLLDNLSDDERVDAAKRDKYGFYAQKLLEIADAKPELIDESKLPDNWRDILLVMSTKGEHGVQLDEDPTVTAAREQAIREAMAEKAAREERIRQARERFKAALFDYFQQNHNSPHPAELPAELAEPLAGYENIVMNRLVADQTPEGFMQGIMAAIGPDAVKEVSERVNKTAK